MDALKASYKEVEDFYRHNLSLCGLNTDISNKFALISLICFVTKQMKKKHPDTTCYQVVMKIVGDSIVDNYYLDFLQGLSIVCEDFILHTTEFMTFDLTNSKDIINKIRDILNTWMPF